MKGICVLLLVCIAYAAALPAQTEPHDERRLEAKPDAVESLEPAESRWNYGRGYWGGYGGHWGGYGGHRGWGHGGGFGYGRGFYGHGGYGHGGYGHWGGYGHGWGYVG